MSKREAYKTRTIFVISEDHRARAAAMVMNLPIDPLNPLEVKAGEQTKVRSPDANARMWAGPLKDISTQAWMDGRQYSPEVLHEHFKREYLPEDDDPELADLVKHPETYHKWGYTPNGHRVLTGSTTDLTVKGFALHMMQVEAFGASLGVMFSASPRERYAA